MGQDNTRRLLTRQDVADIYGISKRYLETAVSKGEGPRIVRLGRLVRYRATDINEWIEASATQAGQQ